VVGVDAHVVCDAPRDLGPGPAAVVAPVGVGGQGVDPVLVRRVDPDMRVVHGPDVQVTHPLPTGAGVLGPVGAGQVVVGELDERVQHARVGLRHGDADAALVLTGDPAHELGPAVAPVRALVDAAPGPAAVEAPAAPEPLVHRGVDLVRVRLVPVEVHGARVLVDVEHLLPALAAVGGTVDAPVLAGRPQVAEGRHVDHVRVGGVHEHLADVPRVLEPQVPPRLAAVVGAVDPVSVGGALAVVLLAGSRVDDVGVRGGQGHVAERAHGHVGEGVHPGLAAVLALPQPAGGRGDPEHVRVLGDGFHVVDPSTRHGGSDDPGVEGLEMRLGERDLRLAGGGNQERRGNEGGEQSMHCRVLDAWAGGG
jgi:hypothetical protein